MAPAETQVTVHAAPGSGLGAALLAALDRRGWRPEERQQGVGSGERHLIVVEDDAGTPVPGAVPRPDRAIAIGSLRSASTLAALAGRGAIVLNQDVPFLMLLRQVETALAADPAMSRPMPASGWLNVSTPELSRTHPHRPDRLDTGPRRDRPRADPPQTGQDRAERIRARAAEATALARLTERERAVLCGLAQGLSAAALARQGSRSVATIRSQIQSLTRRLGVGSSLAAVAMLQRSGHQAVPDCLETLHRF